MKVAEKILEKISPMASDSDKKKYKGINDKIDALEVKKQGYLDIMSKEADDNKRGQAQDALHATREEITKLMAVRKSMLNKFRGLRSKD